VSWFRKTIVQSLALTGGFLAGLQGHTEAAQAPAADRTVIADWPYVNHDTYGTRKLAARSTRKPDSASGFAVDKLPHLRDHDRPLADRGCYALN
jgi:hypothetical protein